MIKKDTSRVKVDGSPKVIAENDLMQVFATRRPNYADGPPIQIFSHNRVNLDHRAGFAMQCVEKWAMVAAQPDGEDSSGRARLRRATADEIVAHAIECTEKLFTAFAAKEWELKIPEYSEAIDAVKDYENSND